MVGQLLPVINEAARAPVKDIPISIERKVLFYRLIEIVSGPSVCFIATDGDNSSCYDIS